MASYTEGPLSTIGRPVFGPNISGAEIRGFYEASTPTTQCNNTIGKFVNRTSCYICGIAINKQKLVGDGLNPECEHILPIAQAVLFLGLYGDKFKKNQLFYNPDILPKEYAWAHRTCNQIKSDDSYITYKATNPVGTKYQITKPAIVKLLKKIWSNTRKDSDLFNSTLHRYYTTEQNFVRDRINGSAISPSVLKPFEDIVDYLNSFDAPELLLLIGATKALEGPMSEEASTLIGTVDRAAVEESRVRELKASVELKYDSLTSEIQRSLISKFGNNPQTYKEYFEKASYFKPYYVALFVRIPGLTITDWSNYVRIKLLALFYQVHVEEPIAIRTLIEMTKNKRITNNSKLESRKVVALAKEIAKDKTKPWYIAIQKAENSLTNSNTNITFEEAGANIVKRMTPAKKALKKRTTSVKPVYTVNNKNRLSGKKRKREETTNDPRKQAELNQNNLSGGRRKTRKNKN